MAYVPADLVQSVHRKGSVGQNFPLEIPQCLSWVSPHPSLSPASSHTHEDEYSFSLGPTQGLHHPSHLTQTLAMPGASLHPLTSHTGYQTLPRGINCQDSGADQFTSLKGRGLKGAPRCKRKATSFGIRSRLHGYI